MFFVVSVILISFRALLLVLSEGSFQISILSGNSRNLKDANLEAFYVYDDIIPEILGGISGIDRMIF